ncbi:MAG TPA: hypothetical protein VET23_15890 [Chitinophagaceae bacterium]|nr:hypothetical protein [Chitinophagaceae bacterium]
MSETLTFIRKSMFNFFKKKEQGVKVVDKILITQLAKWKALEELNKKENNIVVAFWFAESLQQAQEVFSLEGGIIENFYLAGEIRLSQISGRHIVFAEHYPLSQKENELFEKLQLAEAEVWSAMDEPLFREFGSDKIVQMMKQLGMKENQVIENNLISKAIHNAQDKIGKKILTDQTASSQEDWLRKNWRNS